MKHLLIILLLISPAYSQTPKHLLGENESGEVKITKLGFRYIPHGFDRLRPKKIAKGEAYLRRKNVPAAVITEFSAYAAKFADPNFIPDSIDEAWRQTKTRWLSCGTGSKAAKTVSEFQPSSVTVIVEPGSFWIPYWSLYANGAVMDKGTIRMTAVAMHYLSQPENASLVRFDALALWEMGNIAAMRSGYRITAIEQEIGDSNPCSKIH